MRRYWHRVLKFYHPYISDSGRHEATWTGGSAVADTEAELLEKVLDAMGDCGSDSHSWVTVSERREGDSVVLTQQLSCPYCDEREQMITVYHPQPTNAEMAGSKGQKPCETR
jgi:hypothetical protein